MNDPNLNNKPIPRVERLSEDEMARASLGGPKGSEKLPSAPLTKRVDEQKLPNDEPGHVA